MKAFNTRKKKLKTSVSLLFISLGLVAYQNCGEGYKSNSFESESQGLGVADGEDLSTQIGDIIDIVTPDNTDSESTIKPVFDPSIILGITESLPQNICVDP